MTTANPQLASTRPTHSWLRKVHVVYLPGPAAPLLNDVVENLLEHFRGREHFIQDIPDEKTDVILTTALFGEPLKWRDALLFTARRRYKLDHSPTVFTLVSVTREKLNETLEYFKQVLDKEPPDPQDFAFPGLAPSAYRTLYEQGRRGGPIMALMRTVQTQAMSIRVILVVGDEKVEEAFTFDLVGAFPRTGGSNEPEFYEDLVYRILTAVSTGEITKHRLEGDLIPHEVWRSLSTPAAMRIAGRELGKRQFFTQMVRVADLVHVPALDEAVSSQYSEGCFATWDADIDALVATVTGSARPVDKDNLTDEELAVIVGVRPDGLGARVQHVEGKRNDPPSSEAVELIELDQPLPRVNVVVGEDGKVITCTLVDRPEESRSVPVARSKLHGHRGVRGFDPQLVEHVALDEPFYHYPVSCSTEAQARAIKAAFSRSQAFNDPEDPRQIVFTVLPGHGIVIAEKWVPGKVPFQVMWEFMDSSALQVENAIPQGPLSFVPDEDGQMVLVTK
jgi:hypothetical protein